MKRVLTVVSLLSCVLLGVALVLTSVFASNGRCDFDYRMNEIGCVRQGVNPYDVWHGDVELKPYYPNTSKTGAPEGCSKMVNAYAPWVYAYVFPIALLPEGINWAIYCLMMFAALGFCAMTFFRKGLVIRRRSEDGLILASLPFVVVGHALFSNVSVGNFMPFVLLGVVLMARGLESGRDSVAGLGLAMAMVKPQLGLVFVVPLLMRRRLVACCFGGAICLAFSVLMSVVLKTPLVDLLRQGPAANTEFFFGCGTWPYVLCEFLGTSLSILAGLAIGAMACAAMSWLLKDEADGLVYLMPAAVVSCCWTYTQAYSYAMGCFLAYCLVRDLLIRPTGRRGLGLALVAVLTLPRFLLAWHGVCAYLGKAFLMSEWTYRCCESYNSMLTLLLAVLACIWLRASRSTASSEKIEA